MAIRQNVPPLPDNAALVDPKTGFATIAFQMWWQQLFQNGDTAFEEIDEKLDNEMATAKLLGRTTAGTGEVEQLSITQAMDLVGGAAQGDVLYRGASAWDNLAAGTSGLFLKTQGAAANPIWAAITQGVAVGTSFPGSPATNDLFYRTDRRIEYFYDGTRWLSTQLLTCEIGPGTSVATIAANTDYHCAMPFSQQYDIYIERVGLVSDNTAATPATNYFTSQLKSYDNTTVTNLGAAISTQSDAQNTFQARGANVGAVVATSGTIKLIFCSLVRVAAGAGYYWPSFTYRLVG